VGAPERLDAILDPCRGLVRRAHRAARAIEETLLAFDAPPLVPLAEGLAGHAGFGGDVADRTSRVDAFAETPAAFGAERGVRVKHESLLLVRVRS
jgi:hypothetical protein